MPTPPHSGVVEADPGPGGRGVCLLTSASDDAALSHGQGGWEAAGVPEEIHRIAASQCSRTKRIETDISAIGDSELGLFTTKAILRTLGEICVGYF